MWKVVLLWSDHTELMITSACLAPTLMSYDVYTLEIIMVELQTLQLSATTLFHIALPPCTHFKDIEAHKGVSDTYCITFIYLSFYKLFYPHRPALVAITISSLASTHV